ncbi:MAG: type II toxin-antitoxin system HicA family toxin [Acaryochloridaceae cyanobacterium RU_4_10]|nr:type II toxin-antitoxin system HicA family toxin [Acaryochloridaceae cyanobacterium RU_4_10]
MPRLRRLSGLEVIEILAQFGFQVHSQKGSHIKLRRLGAQGKETLTVPNHRELDTGTCRAILRQATRYIPEDKLIPYFYD